METKTALPHTRLVSRGNKKERKQKVKFLMLQPRAHTNNVIQGHAGPKQPRARWAGHGGGTTPLGRKGKGGGGEGQARAEAHDAHLPTQRTERL